MKKKEKKILLLGVKDRLYIGFFYTRNHPWHTLAHEVCIPLDHIGTAVSKRRDIRHLGTGVSRRQNTNSSRYGCIKETRPQSSRPRCIKESRHQSSWHEYIKEMRNQSSRHRCIKEMRYQSSRHECTRRTKAQRKQKDRRWEGIDKCERSFLSSVLSSPISPLNLNISLFLHLSITFPILHSTHRIAPIVSLATPFIASLVTSLIALLINLFIASPVTSLIASFPTPAIAFLLQLCYLPYSLLPIFRCTICLPSPTSVPPLQLNFVIALHLQKYPLP